MLRQRRQADYLKPSFLHTGPTEEDH